MLSSRMTSHAVRVEAERAHALRIRVGLHRREREVCEHAAYEKLYEPVASERLFRDATVDERDGHAAPTALAEEARPKLRLHHQRRRRFDRSERAAHAPGPVERKIEDERRRVAEGLARHALPRPRSRRDDERVARVLFEYGARERSRRLRLADRDAVEPHHGPPARVETGQSARALHEARGVLPVTRRVKKKPRQQREDAEAEEDAVKEIHQD